MPAKAAFTGKKLTRQEVLLAHRPSPGGIKERTAKQILEGRFPERVVAKGHRTHDPRAARSAASRLRNLRV